MRTGGIGGLVQAESQEAPNTLAPWPWRTVRKQHMVNNFHIQSTNNFHFQKALNSLRISLKRVPEPVIKSLLAEIHCKTLDDLFEELATDLMGLAKLSDRQLVQEGTKQAPKQTEITQ